MMPQPYIPRLPSRAASPYFLALLLLVLSLLIFFGSGWAFYSLFRDAKEYELSERLKAIGLATEPLVASEAGFALRALEEDNLPETDAEWSQWFESLGSIYSDQFSLLEARLEELRQRVGVKALLLISPRKRIICAMPERLARGSVAPLVDMDRAAWESALRGVAEDVPYYEYGGVPYSRVYVPIRLQGQGGEEEEVAAVLRVEGGLETFEEIRHLRAQGLILAGVVTALMATVALLFYRLIRLFARVERSSAHRDRLEAMGTLAAGIAHEIRNPLGIIRTLAEALRGDLKPDDPGQEMLGDLLGEVQRLNNLVTQYLAFARPDAVGAEGSCNPDAIARSLATLLEKGEKGAAHPIVLEIPENLLEVRMHANTLQQVLLNLLINAREASPVGSPVRVQCAARRGGTQLAIRVMDRGAGIAPKELRRIFDPFYTTKPGGSGLGLAICRRLVENADGTISVESQLGQGTTVEVVLPAGKT